VTSTEREEIVNTIIALYDQKDYVFITLTLAISIVDRYLAILAADPNKLAPNHSALACAALLIAAKIEQSIAPSFQRMINLLPLEKKQQVNKSYLLKLERDIIRTL
jgi:hypothetical protein